MFRLLNNYFYYLLFLKDCTCNGTMEKNGNGNCQTRARKFTGLLSCVVNQPSSCEDLVNDTKDTGEQLSTEACQDINQGNMLLHEHKNTLHIPEIPFCNNPFIESSL